MRSFTPVLLVVISLGLFYLHISPRYTEVQELRTQVGQYNEALTRAKALEAERDNLLTSYNTFSPENLSRLEKLIPDSVNTVKLITDIDSIAARYSIAVRSVTTAEQPIDNAQSVATSEAQQTPFKTTVITFRFSSSYQNLVLFLKDIEKSLQLVDVESVNFDVPPDAASKGVYGYQVSIQTYSLK